MDITTEAGALFDNHPRLKSKALLLDITIVNPFAGSNLGNTARPVGKHLADAVERKKNKYRGSFPATYSLLPLAMSTCGDVGSDVHVFIKELAIRRVEHRSETHSQRVPTSGGKDGSSTSLAAIIFCFTAGTSIPHPSPSLQAGGGACEHPTSPFSRPDVCSSASYRGGDRVRGTGRSERGRGRDWSRGREQSR